MHDLNVVRRQPELVRHDLGERRLMSLALSLYRDREYCLACRVHAQVGAIGHAQAENVHLVARPGAHALGEEADADAHVLATGPALCLFPAQLLVAGHVESQPQRPRVVA